MSQLNKLSLLITILFLVVSYSTPLEVKAANESDVKQVVEDYYDAIVKQNFGIAADYYSVPVLGAKSPNPKYKRIKSTIEYFDYLYPQINYTISEFEIVIFDEVDKDTYHANIRLQGEGTSNPEGISFNQDILITLGEDNNWKLSIEDYVKYIKSISLSKPVEKLTDRELIFRFFSEIENGNYGVATGITSPKMSSLESETNNAITAYLKEWNSGQQTSDDRITPEQLYIINEIPLNNDNTLYLVASNPVRNENQNKARLTTNSLFTSSGINPAYQFIQIDHIDGNSFINLADGNKSYANALASGEEQENKAEGELKEFSGLISFLTKIAVGLSVVLAVVLCIFFGLKNTFPRSDNDRPYSPRERNTSRESTQVDIEESVDQLLTSYKNNSNEDENAINESQVHSKNQTRQIHISSIEHDDKPITHIPSNSRRKIHTDDD